MDLFIEFIGARWYLFVVLILIMFMLMNHERRRGGPNISPAQLSMLVNRHEGVVVDLREATDFRQGHIVDSISIPMAKFYDRAAELERYKDKPVVLVCKYGQTTIEAAKTLRQRGFAQVFKLGGGIGEWRNQQLPLVRS